MALLIPSISDPRDPNNPLVEAYAWISGLALDLAGNRGRVTLNVHPNADAWQGVPVTQIGVSLGELFGPTWEGKTDIDPPVTVTAFPSLQDLMADPEFAQAYAVIGTKLYAALKAHPTLTGSTDV